MARQYFDLFLIYQPAEQARAEQIARRLTQAGYQVCLSQESGDLARSLRCAVLLGAAGLGQTEPPILTEALTKARRDQAFRLYARDQAFRVWLLLLPGLDDPFDPNSLPPGLANTPWLDLRQRNLADFEFGWLTPTQVKATYPLNTSSTSARKIPGPFIPATTSPKILPYPGLAAFGEEQAALFGGREAAVQRLVEKLRVNRFLAVVGPAGSGKSSLVQAGLIPALRAQHPGLTVKVIRPADRLLAAPETVIEDEDDIIEIEPVYSVVGEGELEEIPPLPLNFSGSRERSGGPARSPAPTSGATPRQALLFVDQFEEIFTLFEQESERTAFIADLFKQAASRSADTYFVITLRTDYLPACAAYPDLAAKLAAQFLVGPLDRGGLQQAIEEPACQNSLKLEAGLVGFLLDDLADFEETSRAEGRVLNLSLLQYSLQRLYESGEDLTLAAYQRQGRLANTLAQQAEALYNSLDRAGQALLRNILLHLAYTPLATVPSDTRYVLRPALLEKLAERPRDLPAVRVILDQLVAARLVETDLPGEAAGLAENRSHGLNATLRRQLGELLPGSLPSHEPAVEPRHYWLASEAAVESWPRLRQWVEDRYAAIQVARQLRQTAQEWQQHNRPDHLLYRGVRLAQAEECLELDPNLDELERQFIRQSQRQVQRRTRWLVGTLGAILAAFFLVILVTWWQIGQVRQARDDNQELAATAQAQANGYQQERDLALQSANNARQGQATAFSRELAADATAQLGGNSQLALLLAVEAVRTAPSPEARLALQRSLVVPRPQATYPAFDAHNSLPAAFSPNDQLFAIGQGDGSIQVGNLGNRSRPPGRVVGREGPIKRLLFNPVNSDELITSYYSGAVVVNRVNNPRPQIRLTGLTPPNDLQVSSDGNWVAQTASEDNGPGNIRVWNISLGQTANDAAYNLKGSEAVFVPDNSSLVFHDDNSFSFWSLRDKIGQVKTITTTAEGKITDLIVSPDSKYVAVLHATGKLQVWQPGKDVPFTVINADSVRPRHLAFSPDSQLLIGQEANGPVDIWQFVRGTDPGTTISKFNSQATGDCFDVSPDGRALVTCSGSRVTVRNLPDGRVRAILDLPTVQNQTGVTAFNARFSPDGKYLLTSDLRNVQLWLLDDRQSFEQPGGGIRQAGLAVSDGSLGAVSNDGTFHLWDNRGHETTSFSTSDHKLQTLAFSPNKDQGGVAIGGEKGTLYLASGKRSPLRLDGHTDTVTSLAFNSAGSRLLSASLDGTLRVWQTSDGAPLFKLEMPTGFNNAVFSPDGLLVAASNNQGNAYLWQPGSSNPPVSLQGHLAPVIWTTFSPDGKLVATASTDSTVRIWDLTGKELAKFSPESNPISRVVFSPDSRLVLLAGQQAAYIGDPAKGTLLQTLAPGGPVTALDWSQDNTLAALGNQSGEVELWDVRTGQLITTLALHGGAVNSLLFSPDGQQVLSASADGTTYMTNCRICAPTDTLLQQAQALSRQAGRQLTPDERRVYLHETN